MSASEKKQNPKGLGVNLLILVLLAGWVITVGWFSTSYINQIRAIQELTAESGALRHQLVSQGSEFHDQFVNVNAKVDDFARYLQNQTALIARITGDIIPLQMPPGWEDELVRLEAIAKSEALRPKYPASTSSFRDYVKKLIADTPAWAEPYYLERLASLRWSGLVLNEVGLEVDIDDSGAQFLQTLQTHFDNLLELETIAPSFHDEGIMDMLVEHAKTLAADSVRHVRAASIRNAQAQLQTIEGSDPQTADLLGAYAWLERIHEDSEIESLKQELTKRINVLEVQRQLEHVSSRYETLKQIAKDDPELLEQGTRLLIGELGAARGRLAFEGTFLEALDSTYNLMQRDLLQLQQNAFKAEESVHSEAIVRYQQWALRTIRNTEQQLQIAKDEAKDNAVVYGRNWEAAQFRRVSEAMLVLLTVDTRFLDWPLAELFQETMVEGNKILKIHTKGASFRKRLAEKSVEVKKKPLGDI